MAETSLSRWWCWIIILILVAIIIWLWYGGGSSRELTKCEETLTKVKEELKECQEKVDCYEKQPECKCIGEPPPGIIVIVDPDDGDVDVDVAIDGSPANPVPPVPSKLNEVLLREVYYIKADLQFKKGTATVQVANVPVKHFKADITKNGEKKWEIKLVESAGKKYLEWTVAGGGLTGTTPDPAKLRDIREDFLGLADDLEIEFMHEGQWKFLDENAWKKITRIEMKFSLS